MCCTMHNEQVIIALVDVCWLAFVGQIEVATSDHIHTFCDILLEGLLFILRSTQWGITNCLAMQCFSGQVYNTA